MDDAEIRQRVGEVLATYDTSRLNYDVKEGVVELAGLVDSEDRRREIGVVVAQVRGVREIRNDLQVEYVAPEEAALEGAYEPPQEAEQEARESDVVGRGTEVDLNDEVGTDDTMEAASEAEPYFPPTDVVVRPAPESEGGYEVVGGFGSTSMDEAEQGHGPVSSVERGDEQIADDVRRELREDSLTTDLEVKVFVLRGVVYLRGTVATLDDAEAAEEVAGRVPGVLEVREELTVAA